MAPDRKREKKKADPKKGPGKNRPKDKSAKGPPRTNRRSQG
jgi:hypothetical protein